MTRDLFERIGNAFTAGAATMEEQDLLRDAAAPASVRSFEDLPAQAQRLLADLETRGRTA